MCKPRFWKEVTAAEIFRGLGHVRLFVKQCVNSTCLWQQRMLAVLFVTGSLLGIGCCEEFSLRGHHKEEM